MIPKSPAPSLVASLSALILIRFKVLLSPLSPPPPLKGKEPPPLLGWQVLSDNPPNSKFRFIEGASSISNFHKVPQEGSINALFPSCMSSSSLISVRLPYVVQEMFYHLGIVVKC